MKFFIHIEDKFAEVWEVLDDMWSNMNWFGRIMFWPIFLLGFPMVFLVALGFRD